LAVFQPHHGESLKGERRVRPDHKGRNIKGVVSKSTSKNSLLKLIKQPKVTLVTRVAQAVEMAKSLLKREQKLLEYSDDGPRKRQKMDKVCF
jgi:hypothetical protein